MQLQRLDYYTALEIDANASAETVERACRFSIDNYAEDSVATYGLISDAERREALRYFEEAQRVLCDEALRSEYDASLIKSGRYQPHQLRQSPAPMFSTPDPVEQPEAAETPTSKSTAPASDDAAQASESPTLPVTNSPSQPPETQAETEPGNGDGDTADDTILPQRPTEPAEPEPAPRRDSVEDSLLAILDGNPLGGAQLRQIRELRGLSVEEVATHTKISMTNIRFIEEEDFRYLPALVYLRGFLRTYARLLRIDAGKLLDDYIPRFQQYRAD